MRYITFERPWRRIEKMALAAGRSKALSKESWGIMTLEDYKKNKAMEAWSGAGITLIGHKAASSPTIFVDSKSASFIENTTFNIDSVGSIVRTPYIELAISDDLSGRYVPCVMEFAINGRLGLHASQSWIDSIQGTNHAKDFELFRGSKDEKDWKCLSCVCFFDTKKQDTCGYTMLIARELPDVKELLDNADNEKWVNEHNVASKKLFGYLAAEETTESAVRMKNTLDLALKILCMWAAMPNCVKPGLPTQEVHSHNKAERPFPFVIDLPREIRDSPSSHVRAGHFRSLHHERYRRDDNGNVRIVYVNPCLVKWQTDPKHIDIEGN